MYINIICIKRQPDIDLCAATTNVFATAVWEVEASFATLPKLLHYIRIVHTYCKYIQYYVYNVVICNRNVPPTHTHTQYFIGNICCLGKCGRNVWVMASTHSVHYTPPLHTTPRSMYCHKNHITSYPHFNFIIDIQNK